MFDWDNKIKNKKATWQDYFDTLDDGKKYIVDLIKNTDDLSKLTGEDLVKANQQARASALAHNKSIKAPTFSAKAGKVALQALAIAGNMLVAWGISKIFAYRKRVTSMYYLITLFVYANDTHINLQKGRDN